MGGLWSTPTLPADQHIVIVGAGYGGIVLGNLLLKHQAKFTIISPRDCFHHNVGSLRASVNPDFIKMTLIPLETTFGEHFKKGKVVDIKTKDKQVVLESGETIGYDVLVIATGSTGQFPIKLDDKADKEEATELYKDVNDKIKNSYRVVVIGGGATGTELAVEIAAHYPEKEVVLIHSGPCLISDQPTPNFQKKLKNILDRYYVKVKLGERVENLAGVENMTSCTVKTDKGTEIEADLVFKTIGLPINSSAYKSALSHVMEKSGALKVNEYLRVEGYEDVYAVGDCCNTKDVKLGYTAGAQSRHLVQNLLNKTAGKAEVPWKEGSLPVLLLMALGPRTGLGQLMSGWVIGEWISYFFKAKDTMAGMFWKEMKQPIPS